MATALYRPLTFGVTRASLREGNAGVAYLKADQPLAPFALRMTDRLLHWAQVAPLRTWMARRMRHADGSTGDWRHIGYAHALESARAIGESLLERGLNAQRPVVILSENDLEHALLALGCMVAGIPFCPVSPAYSLLSADHEKLRHVLSILTPGLVFASDGARYSKAIAGAVGDAAELVLTRGEDPRGRAATSFDQLLSATPTDAVDLAMAATGPDTIVKFLFTSGSTRQPKAVINTHRMWCANQQQIRQSIPVLNTDAGGESPVLVDWLPWNHTFGGNHNVGLSLYNGGSLYIDDGKPVPSLIEETLRNLREVAPTVYFNVPTGFEAIAGAMRDDPVLRRNLLSRIKMFFYAGASLPQPIWDSLHQTQEGEIGERIVMGTGLGMTESGPFGLFVTNPHVRAGDLGLPSAGLELKLVPSDDKTEVRYKGPNITPGYWRAPHETAAQWDEEGFFCTGDAVLWIDPSNIHLGLKFDGRIAEDFKLATGTFVNVGSLRSRIIAAGAPFVQDAVVTGLDQKEVGALIFPSAACRTLAGLPPDATLAEVLRSGPVHTRFQQLVDQLAQAATGSANRVALVHVLSDPPSIDRGEVTDKGSINQRAVLKNRSDLVRRLHDGSLPFTIRTSA